MSKSCDNLYNQYIAERNMKNENMTTKQKYKECIRECWDSGFSPAYTGYNRMTRDERCYDRCYDRCKNNTNNRVNNYLLIY